MIEFNVENILEIKENAIILFQKNSNIYSSKCIIQQRISIDIDYKVSLYNIKNKEEKYWLKAPHFFI